MTLQYQLWYFTDDKTWSVWGFFDSPQEADDKRQQLQLVDWAIVQVIVLTEEELL